MAWTEPQYSKSQVDVAGDILLREWASQEALIHVSPDELNERDMDDVGSSAPTKIHFVDIERVERAFDVINNWRSSHSYPLNTLTVGLRRQAAHVDTKNLVAQRIKRLSSIEAKLRRFKTMKLSQMQDIGGCRAIVQYVRQVRGLVSLYKHSNMKHKLDHIDDYIEKPQKSGYRGVHLIYRYYSDKKQTYNGLKIEIQLRSTLQHAWATAVETVGTFIRQALKSSQGAEDWLRFFALMGTALAIREKTPGVPGTPTDTVELVRELRDAAQQLDVVNRLTSFGAALKTLEEPSTMKAHFFLLKLDPVARTVDIGGFPARELEKANDAYIAAERSGVDAVLVAVQSLELLRRAYPNYFLDTNVFLEALKEAIK